MLRGTEISTVGTNVSQIGRAKSRGFEYVSGTETNDIFATSGVWRHYLFDVEMFTHVDLTTSETFTTGETLTGATSGATGVVMSDTATKYSDCDNCCWVPEMQVSVTKSHTDL